MYVCVGEGVGVGGCPGFHKNELFNVSPLGPADFESEAAQNSLDHAAVGRCARA